MINVIVKNAGKKGSGLFANKNFSKNEIILTNDITKIKKKYTLKEIDERGIDCDHWDYAGNNKYVIDYSPDSYVNHSCDPNAYVEFKKIGKMKLIALKPIKKGEEVTKDYTLAAIERINRKNPDEILICRCGSKNCRKKVTMDFFKLPKRIQKEKYAYLPTWVKVKYKDKLKQLNAVVA